MTCTTGCAWWPIEVPPLRARREDTPPLVHHLLNRITSQRGLVRRISPQAMRMLLDYAWPGNVRELANVIEYAVVVRGEKRFCRTILPQEILHPCSATAACPAKNRSIRQPPPIYPDQLSPTSRVTKQRICRQFSKSIIGREPTRQRKLGLEPLHLWRKIRELKLQ